MIQAAQRPGSTGVWGGADTVATSQFLGSAVAVDAAGDALVGWNNGSPPICGTTYTSFRAAGDTGWGSAQAVSPAGQHTSASNLALDPSGNAVAVWTNSMSSKWAAIRPVSTGQWQSAQHLI